MSNPSGLNFSTQIVMGEADNYSIFPAVEKALDVIYSMIWDGPLLLLILVLGILLSVRRKGIQFRYLFLSLKLSLFPGQDEKDAAGDVSHFESLMTALAATIGIGNIAGVATAITIGGMGALFWMWVTATLGMAIKFAEAYLAVRFRSKDKNGEMCGGPMHFIEKGLNQPKLAAAFAIFGCLAALGGGNFIQSNSVADVMESSLSVAPWISGTFLACLSGLTLTGGIRKVGKVAAYLVPVMALFYLSGGIAVIFVHLDQVPGVFKNIFVSAFQGQAAVGGFAGSTVWAAIQIGVARGLSASEAGLGTASIAAAAARTDSPERQGLVSMFGAFLSTIVMCTVTGLIIGSSGVLGTLGHDGKAIDGASLTYFAFESTFPGAGMIVTVGLVFFAFSTILGWGYYGEKCAEYLFHEKVIKPFRLLFCFAIIPGAVLDLSLVWKIADITNALMSIPNLIGVFALSGLVAREVGVQNLKERILNNDYRGRPEADSK